MRRALFWLVVGPLYVALLPARLLAWLFLEDGWWVLLMVPMVLARVAEGKDPEIWGDERHPFYRLRDGAYRKPTGGEVSIADRERAP